MEGGPAPRYYTCTRAKPALSPGNDIKMTGSNSEDEQQEQQQENHEHRSKRGMMKAFL